MRTSPPGQCSTIGEAAGTAAHYVVELIGEEAARGIDIAGFTLKVGKVLGEPLTIRWGLDGDRWYVLSASPAQR
jgi:hypothetical protein